jgi:hypothetical protein
MHGLEKERKERSAERTTFKGREEQAQRSPTSLARLQVACSSRFYRKVMKSSTGHPKRFLSHASSASPPPSFPRPPRLVIMISSAGRTSAVGPNRVITLSSGPHFCLISSSSVVATTGAQTQSFSQDFPSLDGAPFARKIDNIVALAWLALGSNPDGPVARSALEDSV